MPIQRNNVRGIYVDNTQNKQKVFIMAATHHNKFEKRDPWRAIISGGFTGGFKIPFTYPTEYIKTEMQLQKEYSHKGLKFCIQDTYTKFGLRGKAFPDWQLILGFFRGMTPLLVFSVPKVAVRFGTNDFLRAHVFKDKTYLTKFLSGLGAGITEAILVVTPCETIKVKLIHDRLLEKPKYNGMIDGIKKIVIAEGLSGIYKGTLPTVIKQGTNQGIRFLVFDDIKHFIQHTVELPKPVVSLLAGAAAGAVSVFVNNPIDVVKSQMQGLRASQYTGTMDCILKIWQNEGARGFYKGTIPRLGKVCGDVALTFTVYDQSSQLIDHLLPPAVAHTLH